MLGLVGSSDEEPLRYSLRSGIREHAKIRQTMEENPGMRAPHMDAKKSSLRSEAKLRSTTPSPVRGDDSAQDVPISSQKVSAMTHSAYQNGSYRPLLAAFSPTSLPRCVQGPDVVQCPALPTSHASRSPSPSHRHPVPQSWLPPSFARAASADKSRASRDTHVKADWREAASVMDGLLRGPADDLLREPDNTRCRLCKHGLTGNMVADEPAIANLRLVSAMDFAWATCEKFHSTREDLQQLAAEKRKEADGLRRLIAQYRDAGRSTLVTQP